MNKYLNANEVNENFIERNTNQRTPIIVKNASFKWDKESIVGQVGAGKSSLLSALLGDMEKNRYGMDSEYDNQTEYSVLLSALLGDMEKNRYGYVNIDGKVAYVSQQAWIQNTTIRQNILFTNEYNERFYEKVLDSCALRPDLEILSAKDMTEIGEKGINLPDLEILSAKDMTEIGEKGINLSGGQRQRVSLARAVYSDADIYLLDDPLSAVDAHVGRHLFDETIGPKGILRKKTRILVTHKASVLPEVDKIIVLKEGLISEFGSFDELIAKSREFAEFIAEYVLRQESEEVDIEDEKELEMLAKLRQRVKPIIERQESRNSLASDGLVRRQGSHISTTTDSEDQKIPEAGDQIQDIQQNDGKLIDEEKPETGSMKTHVYKKYFHLVGVRLGLFAGFCLVETVFILSAQLSISLGCVGAAKRLHRILIERMMRAPVAYFDTTPIGRNLSRFSEDMELIDSELLFDFRIMCLKFFSLIVSMVMISLETPLIILAILPIIITYVRCQRIYSAGLRQIRRLISTSSSHIISHFGETFNGTSTIRAYGAKRHFLRESHSRIDGSNACAYQLVCSRGWLAIRLELLGYSIVFLSALFSVVFRETVSAGVAALAISYALNITTLIERFIYGVTETETDILAVERCLKFIEMPSEAEWFNDRTKPPSDWPLMGGIVFSNYSTKYRQELDLVLKNITLDVKPRERLAIVGRTGAGKSSLALGLFRLIEATDGTVSIDGIDCSTIGLHDLRSRLTVIPQEPVLFAGSLRHNLDPLDQWSDKEIWSALESAHLKTFVESLKSGLNHEISISGENVSVGQKQLVCLARALLRRTRVLVLDEATAAVDMETDDLIQKTIREEFDSWYVSVDMETDDLIQKTIREEFDSSTVVTIAHRLNSIRDYDKVLVLDNGSIAEFGSPEQLLTDNNSIFYSMAKHEGIV
ncbi:unnamed protein product [Oppiella nova]|uniref:Uncharacterized protein n=1 Tax=Oppiella nova TaxID=334625 RepID=A0A7R9LQK9_9ACAR|nr:unnamed protein product [Oppiella nova]CAG2166002.1 unnamed protein product [Oppiella nova]